MLAASYEAKAYGVRTAMGGRQARRLCPQAIVVPPRMSAYSEASKAVFRVFEDTTPLVEGLSIDEAFLDVRGHASGSPARRPRSPCGCGETCASRSGCRSRSGVARTKFLAKVASGVAKPDGLLVVPPDGELDFLHPLPVERLWGVGPVTAAKLRIARHHDGRPGRRPRRDGARLDARAAPPGRHLHALAHNRDPRPRAAGPPPRLDRLAARARPLAAVARPRSTPTLVALVDRVTRRMRRAGRVGPHGRAAAALRRLLARDPLAHAAARDGGDARDPDDGARAARGGDADDRARAGSRWSASPSPTSRATARVQLVLPFATAGGHALDTVVDEVRERFGTGAITRAVLLGRERSFEMPLLPD